MHVAPVIASIIFDKRGWLPDVTPNIATPPLKVLEQPPLKKGATEHSHCYSPDKSMFPARFHH